MEFSSSVVVTLIVTSIPIIWGAINVYFGLKANKVQVANLKNSVDSQLEDFKESHNKEIDTIKQDMHSQEKAINNIKKDIEDKLDKHKSSTDSKLLDINNTMVETKTLVQLLVEKKLK